MQNYCCVCMELDKILQNIDTFDDNSIKIITKLKKCIPDVEWTIDFMICEMCIAKLDFVYNFQQLCIKSDQSRRVNRIIDNDEKVYEVKNIRPVGRRHQKLICSYCNQTFSLEINLVQHVKAEHSKNREEGELILTPKTEADTTEDSIAAAAAVSINNNNIIKTGDHIKNIIVFVCDICGGSFKLNHQLNQHIKNVHNKNTTFDCDICNQKFSELNNLKAHKLYIHHNSEYGNDFHTSSHLQVHSESHTDQQMYLCDQCLNPHSSLSDLLKHKIWNHCSNYKKNDWIFKCTSPQPLYGSNMKTYSIKKSIAGSNFKAYSIKTPITPYTRNIEIEPNNSICID